MGTPYARWTGTALIAMVAAMPAAGDQDRCHKLYRMTDVSHAIEPGIPVAATDAVPAHCRVRGVINRAIRFEVTLPDEWNGRMMFTAVGGGAGTIEISQGGESVQLPCLLADGLSEGDDAYLSVRPENVDASREPKDGPRIEGEVIQSVFLGNCLDCRVKWGEFEWKVLTASV